MWWHFSPFHPQTPNANPWLLSTDCMVKESGQVDMRGLLYETGLWETQQSWDFEVHREGNQDCSLHNQGEVSMEKYIWKFSRIWFLKQDRNPWTILTQQSTIRYQAAQEKNSWALGLWFDMDRKQDSAFPLYIFSLIHLAQNMLGPVETSSRAFSLSWKLITSLRKFSNLEFGSLWKRS